uniref:Glucosylceramidase n=1 Tax=Alexandrium catenella TaxID=2925 RepID=A0A7S1WHZ0_ALECA
MKVQFSLSSKWLCRFSIPIFLALTVVGKVSFPTAALITVLLPALHINFSMGWCLTIWVAFVVWAANGIAGNQLGIMAGKFIGDMAYSRSLTLHYRFFGDFVQLADLGAPLAPPPVIGERNSPIKVAVIRSGKTTGERLTVLQPMFLSKGVAKRGDAHVLLDTKMRYQTFAGFGGSFTESSADVLLKMSPANQELIMNAYFNTETGLGYNLGRLHMNSCDFSRGNWSCVDKAGDTELKTFSIDRYKYSMIPMVKRAQALAKEPLTLFASPWSPPAWMKDTGRMLSGGKLMPQYREPWANFYVRFARELKKEGVSLWGFTVQNEPHAETPWENCLYNNEEERDFVRDYLGPALNASGMDLKLMVWDHNRDDMFSRAKAVYNDPEAEKYVWGVGYHWYGDPNHEVWPPREGMVLNDNLQRVHELRPDKHIWMTEACQEFGPRIGDWRHAERYGEALIRDFNRWLEAWIDWNLILEANGGPNHVNNFVSAPIIADSERGKVLFLSIYYYIGHFSRYIKPGAVRIAAVANRDKIEVTAFQNPDGSVVAVAMNQQDWDIGFWLQFEQHTQWVSLPSHSMTTFIL